VTETSAFDDHFHNPRNIGVLDGADGRVEVENPVCGDLLVLSWKAAADGRLDAVRFQVYGCPAAIAAGSALTEMAQGAAAAALAAIGPDEVAAALGGLDEGRFHAAVLAADGLRELVKRLRP
jgi:nitrogen fixation NifU-like protein